MNISDLFPDPCLAPCGGDGSDGDGDGSVKEPRLCEMARREMVSCDTQLLCSPTTLLKSRILYKDRTFQIELRWI